MFVFDPSSLSFCCGSCKRVRESVCVCECESVFNCKSVFLPCRLEYTCPLLLSHRRVPSCCLSCCNFLLCASYLYFFFSKISCRSGIVKLCSRFFPSASLTSVWFILQLFYSSINTSNFAVTRVSLLVPLALKTFLHLFLVS